MSAEEGMKIVQADDAIQEQFSRVMHRVKAHRRNECSRDQVRRQLFKLVALCKGARDSADENAAEIILDRIEKLKAGNYGALSEVETQAQINVCELLYARIHPRPMERFDVTTQPRPSPADEIAFVGLACGRQYLSVGGLIVAMETDLCREAKISDRHWTGENLQDACDTILAAMQPEPTTGPKVKCTICGATMPTREIAGHWRDYHPKENKQS